MAHAILEGFAKKGVACKLFDLKENHISDIMTDVLKSKYIAVGSPTLNTTMMPTVAAFLCYMKGLHPQERKALAFGSYGWGGQAIKEIYEILEKMGCEMMCDQIKTTYIPSDEYLNDLENKIASLL